MDLGLWIVDLPVDIKLISTGIPNLLPARDRSPGLHHSEVLHDLLVREGHYSRYMKQRSELPADMVSGSDMSRMQLGLAFEDTLVDRYKRNDPDLYISAGEYEIDGLYITLDLVNSMDGCPDSIKYTWLSAKHEIGSDKFLYHWMQLKSECVALGVDVGRLHICHNNGNYDYKTGVHFNVWEGKFDKLELSKHRDKILRHRDRMVRERTEQL